jgi:hypothetical protein
MRLVRAQIGNRPNPRNASAGGVVHCWRCETLIRRMPNGKFFCPNLECEECKPPGAAQYEVSCRAL